MWAASIPARQCQGSRGDRGHANRLIKVAMEITMQRKNCGSDFG